LKLASRPSGLDTDSLPAAPIDFARQLRLVRLAQLLGWSVLVGCLVVLAGWILRIERFVHIVPGTESMKFNVTIGTAVLAGLVIDASRPSVDPPAPAVVRARRYAAGFVVALGLLTVAQTVFDLDLGIDELLIDDFTSPTTDHAGRMSELSSLCLILMGSAFLLIERTDHGADRASGMLALLVFAIGYFCVMGYLFDAEPLYHPRAMTALSLQGAVLFAFTAAGFILARTDRGLGRWLSEAGPVGVLLRRLMPVVLFVAPLIGWMQATASMQSGSVVAAYVALSNVALLLALVFWTARAMQTVVSERTRAEANVKTSEERLNWALHAAGGGAWDWDLVGAQAWWSPEMYELWRVSDGTPMNFTNSVERIDPRDRREVTKHVTDAIATHSDYRCEFRILNDGGPERWMESRGRAAYDASGRAVRLLGITIDITAQKNVELSLRQANEVLERSNVELQRFAVVASHDLQTPLRTISSFAELLTARYSKDLPDQALHWLTHIATSAERLQSMVKGLLQYARIDSRGEPFAPVPMELMLQRALDVFDLTLQESGGTFESGALPTIHGDASQLPEVWLNLIGNALKYRAEQPPSIEVSAMRQDGDWLFCVADNGIGIEARHCERIFEMFERLHDADTYPGTGIGLAICRRVIERHGGRIWVESEPGIGSKFYFTLPTYGSRS